MEICTHVPATLKPGAELDRLGDEIAEPEVPPPPEVPADPVS
jgi:hypothetical protein